MRCLAEHVGEVLLDHHDERSWETQERGGGLSARRGWEGLPNPDLEVPTKRGEGLPPRWVGASRRALPDRGGLHPLPEGTSWCRRHSRGTAPPIGPVPTVPTSRILRSSLCRCPRYDRGNDEVVTATEGTLNLRGAYRLPRRGNEVPRRGRSDKRCVMMGLLLIAMRMRLLH